MNKTIDFFEFQASVYDRYQFNCVPQYEEMVSIAVDFLARYCTRSPAPSILDLGCGTGNTSRALTGRFPDVRLTCADGSQQMIDLARAKLSPRDVEFHCTDLATPGWGAPWQPGTFDAVISVLVLEHLPFPEYRALLKEVLRLMKPGAWFVAVEGHAGPLNQQLYFGLMTEWEARAVTEGKLTQEELREIKAISAEKETHYFALPEEKRRWWEEAGLADATTIWQFYCVSVMVARKP
jgi:tRNA (cmo5U34)-methyltransferase